MKKNVEVIYKGVKKTEFKIIRVDLDRAEELVWEVKEDANAGDFLTAREMKKVGVTAETLVSFDWATGAHGVY